MTEKEKIRIKTGLLNECILIQQRLAETARQAMQNAQETANDEKSTMEDKFESFREQMQIERDMYARLYDEAMTILENLRKINVNRIQEAAATGALVITTEQKYFVSHSLGKIEFEGQTFMAISPLSPVFRAFAGKKKKDYYLFRDKKTEIIDIF